MHKKQLNHEFQNKYKKLYIDNNVNDVIKLIRLYENTYKNIYHNDLDDALSVYIFNHACQNHWFDCLTHIYQEYYLSSRFICISCGKSIEKHNCIIEYIEERKKNNVCDDPNCITCKNYEEGIRKCNEEEEVDDGDDSNDENEIDSYSHSPEIQLIC